MSFLPRSRRIARLSDFPSIPCTCQGASRRRRAALTVRALTTSTTHLHEPRTIAVLGGGIAGLASALYLSRALAKSQGRLGGRPWKILLIERQDRLGGWVHSQRVSLPDSTSGKGTTALLESGPRSLRPAGYSGLVMLELIRSLSLLPRMLAVPKSASAARNRFIYYPDKLSRLPSSILSALTSLRLPVLRGFVSSLLSEPFTRSRFWRPKSESPAEVARQRQREALQDESVDAFVTRRFGGRPQVAQNLVSAVIHGIYAGDSRTLSVRSVLPFMWNTERRHGSLVRALLPASVNRRLRPPQEAETAREQRLAAELKHVSNQLGDELVQTVKNCSMYSFPEGVEEITRAMEKELSASDFVEIVNGTECKSLSVDGNTGEVTIDTTRGNKQCHRIIAAIPSHSLATMLPASSATDKMSAALMYNSSSNVGVVNFAIPASLIRAARGVKDRLLPVEGFGFLVPRTTPDNKDALLGVVFDSDALPMQDESETLHRPTKLTVMMGGTTHWPPSSKSTGGKPQFPSERELQAAAKRALSTTLSIPTSLLDDPQTVVQAHLQRDAIPQYLVGHPIRMASLHSLLKNQGHTSDGSALLPLTLVGASYTGVSLNDCVANAERTVRRILFAESAQAAHREMVTGLEEFEEPTTEAEQLATRLITAV